jgi:hypothetical protein
MSGIGLVSGVRPSQAGHIVDGFASRFRHAVGLREDRDAGGDPAVTSLRADGSRDFALGVWQPRSSISAYGCRDFALCVWQL